MTGGVVVPENVVLRSICTSTEAEPRAKESQGKPSKAKQKPSQAVVVWREGRGGKGTKNNNRGGGCVVVWGERGGEEQRQWVGAGIVVVCATVGGGVLSLLEGGEQQPPPPQPCYRLHLETRYGLKHVALVMSSVIRCC